MENETFGASNTSKEVLAAYGALAGTAEGGKQAAALARQMYPDPEKANPWVATYEFFNAALQRASEPGQTTFGTFTGAVPAVMDYYTAKDKELAETKRARLEAGFKLAPALKPGAGKITYRPATKEELVQYGATAGQMGSDNRFYDLSKTPASGSTTTGSYVFQNTAAYERYKIKFPAIAEMLTEGQKTGTEPLIINKSLLTDPELPNVFKEPPSSASGSTDFDQFTFTSPEAAVKWMAANEGYTLTEAQKSGDASIILPKSMALIPANSSILELSLKPADPETVYKNFRTNYTKDAAYKMYNDLKANMDAVNTNYELAYELELPGVADMSMIFAYMKMLDPTSVVREGEQAQARGTGDAFTTAANLYNKLLNDGGSLQDAQRRSFRNAALRLYEQKTIGLDDLNIRFQAEADSRDLVERFNLYKITPKVYDLKVFGNYPGDAEIDALTGSSGLTTLSIIAQYENINTNQLAKINQRIAQIKIDLGL